MERNLFNGFPKLGGLGLNIGLQLEGLTPGQADTAVNAVRRGDEEVLNGIFAPRNMFEEHEVRRLQETGKVPLLGFPWLKR